MTTAEKLLTADEFYALPTPEGSGKMELWDGEVVTMAPANFSRGRRALKMGAALDRFAVENNLGVVGVETGFRLRENPARVLAPDAFFLTATRVPTGDEAEKFVAGPPTLAVEVASPNDTDSEVTRKVEAYLDSGAERVWVVRPEQRSITVHFPGGDAHTYREGETLTSPDAAFAVEGFALAVGEVFS